MTGNSFCLFLTIALWVLATLLGAAPCFAQRLTGAWEGTYSESRRVVVFGINFESETKGTLQILGKQIPITATRPQIGNVEIRTQDEDPTVFTGKGEGDVITGELRYSATALHFRMEREPPLTQPSNREEAWRQDLDYAQRKLLRLETSFTPASRRQFLDSLAKLKASTATSDDPHIIVELARAVAAIHNAHTRLYLLRNRTDLRRLPIRVWWFRDRLHIIRTLPEQKNLLGCEVVRITSAPVQRAKRMVDGLYAGSDGWRDYMSTYTLTSPEILYGANIAPDMESIRWDLKCDGKNRSVDLRPLPLRHSTEPVESWWDLAPGAPPTLPEGEAMSLPIVPAYLRHPDRAYWYEFFPALGVIYFQYNRAAADQQHPMAKIEEELAKEMTDHPHAALIVDLRFNTGGDGNVGRQMMERLQSISTSRKVYMRLIF